MKKVVILALLMWSCQSEKQKDIEYKGYDFTGLRDSVKAHPHQRPMYHTKKLWGYI